MKTLLIVAALTASPALADDITDYVIDYGELKASQLRESCEYVIAPQVTPDDTYRAMDCAHTVEAFFIYTKGLPDLTTPANIRCGGSILVAHGKEDKLAVDILSSEFDKACGEPGLM